MNKRKYDSTKRSPEKSFNWIEWATEHVHERKKYHFVRAPVRQSHCQLTDKKREKKRKSVSPELGVCFYVSTAACVAHKFCISNRMKVFVTTHHSITALPNGETRYIYCSVSLPRCASPSSFVPFCCACVQLWQHNERMRTFGMRSDNTDKRIKNKIPFYVFRLSKFHKCKRKSCLMAIDFIPNIIANKHEFGWRSKKCGFAIERAE